MGEREDEAATGRRKQRQSTARSGATEHTVGAALRGEPSEDGRGEDRWGMGR